MYRPNQSMLYTLKCAVGAGALSFDNHEIANVLEKFFPAASTFALDEIACDPLADDVFGELCRNAHSLARLCLNAMGLQPSEDAFFHNYQLDSKELLQWNCYLDGYTSVDKAMLRLQQHLKLILKFVKNGQRKLPESLHSMLHCILKCEQFVNDPKNHIYSTSLLKAVEEDCQKLLNTMEGCENCSEATVSQPLQSDAIILQFCLPGFEDALLRELQSLSMTSKTEIGSNVKTKSFQLGKLSAMLSCCDMIRELKHMQVIWSYAEEILKSEDSRVNESFFKLLKACWSNLSRQDKLSFLRNVFDGYRQTGLVTYQKRCNQFENDWKLWCSRLTQAAVGSSIPTAVRQELVDEVMWLALINCKYLFWNTYVRAMHDTSLARPVAQIFGEIPFVSETIIDEKPLALVALLKLFDDNAIITDVVASKHVLELMRNLIEFNVVSPCIIVGMCVLPHLSSDNERWHWGLRVLGVCCDFSINWNDSITPAELFCALLHLAVDFTRKIQLSSRETVLNALNELSEKLHSSSHRLTAKEIEKIVNASSDPLNEFWNVRLHFSLCINRISDTPINVQIPDCLRKVFKRSAKYESFKCADEHKTFHCALDGILRCCCVSDNLVRFLLDEISFDAIREVCTGEDIEAVFAAALALRFEIHHIGALRRIHGFLCSFLPKVDFVVSNWHFGSITKDMLDGIMVVQPLCWLFDAIAMICSKDVDGKLDAVFHLCALSKETLQKCMNSGKTTQPAMLAIAQTMFLQTCYLKSNLGNALSSEMAENRTILDRLLVEINSIIAQAKDSSNHVEFQVMKAAMESAEGVDQESSSFLQQVHATLQNQILVSTNIAD